MSGFFVLIKHPLSYIQLLLNSINLFIELTTYRFNNHGLPLSKVISFYVFNAYEEHIVFFSTDSSFQNISNAKYFLMQIYQ